MTKLEALKDLAAKVECVEVGDKCHIPSPKVKGRDARIMGYVEGYVVMRHKGCVPFLMGRRDVINFLRALIAQEESR